MTPVAEVKKPDAKSSVGGSRFAHLGVGRALAGADDPPGLGLADPEHRRRRALGGDVERGPPGATERGVALEIARGQDDLPDVVAVAAGEPVPPVVERVPELAAARDRLERRAVGLEPEVAARGPRPASPPGCVRFLISPPLLPATP